MGNASSSSSLNVDCCLFYHTRRASDVSVLPNFFCTDPRSFHKGDIVSSSRVIVGVDAAIADAASLALMVESVGLGTDQWKDAVKR